MRLITLGEMAAAVSNSGGFGQIGASGASAELLRTEIGKAKALTERPFGLNIPIYRSNAFEALEIAIEEGIKTITTSAGDPGRMIKRIKEAGLKVLHKVSTVKMALKAQAAGVDGVIATGFEAGGHVGRECITTFCLVPLLAEALEIPVVAAGGIGDGRGLLAAFALGAEGVEMGTRFVATRECSSPDWYKTSILSSGDGSTLVLGESMPMRVLRNAKAERMAHPDKDRQDDGGQNGEASYVAGNAEEAIMPAGQVASLIKELKGIADVFPDMIREAETIVTRLNRFFNE
jgi:enoyl-[acyl-carrier protein] reductase II